MSKKLLAKASLIQLPPVVPAPAEARMAEPAGPVSAPADARESREAREGRVKTAPGSMAHFMASQSTAMKEAEDLRERLRTFDGAQPVRPLDPKLVKPSRWANRHEHAFADAAFEALKTEIASAGGNVQPVSVRRLVGDAGPGGFGYELVFGHRRHRACLALGLPLLAMVVEVTDKELFEAMERENRARKNLSAWEQGSMYRRALDEGLYASQRKLAESLGVDVSLVSKSLSLARLPETVVAAFPSPLDIQFRWAQPLAEALQRDPDALVTRALRLKEQGGSVPAARVFAVLIGAEPLVPPGGVLNRSTPAARRVVGQGARRATVSRDAGGRVNVQFAAGALDGVGESELLAWVEQILAGRVAAKG